MLFNSPVFIFAFLPATLIGFHVLSARAPRRVVLSWLVFASVVFWAWWSPRHTPLFVGSILFNYLASRTIVRWRGTRAGTAVLWVGVLANLGMLGYYKYTGFLVVTLNDVLGTTIHVHKVLLPLGISFFTFQQIAYLVDASRGEGTYGLVEYALFVSFFPQLIAGPIVHPKEVLPQFARGALAVRSRDVNAGITMFLIGLFKKVLVADTVAAFASPVFAAAASGARPGLVESWGGAIAYTLQLYFDFSGYSDMALGLGLLFGVRIPINFNSPYKATSIVDFWRRWHMTLSRFLRDYVYVPLGGNRRGPSRRYANLLATMVIGGLWHGAGWTFVLWGALHGVYLVANHGWRAARTALGWAPEARSAWGRALARALTFVAVVVGWVLFRARNTESALALLSGMAGRNRAAPALFPTEGIAWCAAFLAIAWLAPNSQEWLARERPAFEPIEPHPRFAFRPTVWVGVAMGALFFFVLKSFVAVAPTEFLYFTF